MLEERESRASPKQRSPLGSNAAASRGGHWRSEHSGISNRRHWRALASSFGRQSGWHPNTSQTLLVSPKAGFSARKSTLCYEEESASSTSTSSRILSSLTSCVVSQGLASLVPDVSRVDQSPTTLHWPVKLTLRADNWRHAGKDGRKPQAKLYNTSSLSFPSLLSLSSSQEGTPTLRRTW